MKFHKIELGFTGPNMIPMIDIIFQLVMFFMIAITFENSKADERVKLPRDMLAKPPEALRQTQALLRRVDTQEVLDRMELENSHFAERLQSDEVKGAIAAFFASRTKTPA